MYLAPVPAEPFRRLTDAFVARWPDHPPYAGKHPEVIPHLTLGESGDETELASYAAEARDMLPIRSRVSAARLIVCDGERWSPHTRLPLG